jgi:hypothetical protein
MPEKSTTPDLVERWRQTNEAFVRRDFDAMMSFFAPEAVWGLSSAGIGGFEGADAIRRFHADWIGSYGDYENQVEALGPRQRRVVWGAFSGRSPRWERGQGAGTVGLYRHLGRGDDRAGDRQHRHRIDRFQRRGRSAARSEWRLITATHNLQKLYSHQQALATA